MYDPIREADELREQLSSDKRRIAFLFGAGTSQAVGLPGIAALTDAVRNGLGAEDKGHYDRFVAEGGSAGTIEFVLDKVRLCRELIGSSKTYEAGGLKGAEATTLDRSICRGIFTLVSVEPPKGLDPQVRFAQWVRSIRREWPVEIFTTNYDVLIERGLETTQTPHFDGFVGSVSPYFSNVTVEAESTKAYELTYPPRSWVRVWKLHGSIGWRAIGGAAATARRIVRTYGTTPSPSDELLIFPSREKYSDSRKLPFVAYHDRLRRLLSGGEALLVIAGYSFGDDHINEIVFEALRNNPRLAVAALMYEKSPSPPAGVLGVARSLRNFSVYGPDQACIAGTVGPWSQPIKAPSPPLTKWPFWDNTFQAFTLGDFSAFSEFLAVAFTAPGVASPVSAGSAGAASAP